MEALASDWKLFRNCIVEWQESYIEKLNKEYVEILIANENASDKFWKLEKRIKNDKKHLGVVIELNKKNMIWDIVTLINEDVITVESLEGFSDELKEQVSYILKQR